MVIDAHLHLFDRAAFRYPWIEGDAELDRDWLEAETGDSGVTGFVFVEAAARPEDATAEAKWAAGRPGVLGVVAAAVLNRPDTEAQLDALRAIKGVVGIRHNLQSASPALFDSETFAAGLRAAAERGLTFDACVRWHQLPSLAALLRQAPELEVVLDHLGKPPVAELGKLEHWRAHLLDLAHNPRVSVKLSGLYAECPPRTADLNGMVLPWLRAALQQFGADRAMIASDWPVSTRGGRYDQWYRLVLDDLGLSAGEREAVASGTASRVYGL